jgi:xylulokinase
VFGRRVVILETQEGSAYGAALLAMAGTGAFQNVREACAATVREVESREPGADAAFYKKGHAVYQSLYPALRDVYAAIGALP